MTEVVLDVSAILPLLDSEPGAEVVAEFHRRGAGAISAVNLAERGAKLAERGAPLLAIQSAIAALQLEIHEFDTHAALASAALRPSTRSARLSLGDRACVALAQSLQLPAVTTDRSWTRTPLPVEVILARP